MPKYQDNKTDKSIFEGRRARLRKVISDGNLHSMPEVSVLEYILGLAIPRVDVHPTAYRLMEKFGSLHAVLNAHPDKLLTVPGMGEGASAFITFLKQFIQYYAQAICEKPELKSLSDMQNYLAPIMKTYSNEEFIYLCLDKNGKLLLEGHIKGGLNSVHIDLRKFIDAILRVQTSAVVIAHNHIDSPNRPSEADVRLTRTIVNLCAPIEIDVLDHLVFNSNGDAFSFSNEGIMTVLKKEAHYFATGAQGKY